MSFPLAWIGATLLLLGALYLTKSLHNHRLATREEVHWRGLVSIAVIGGAIVAYIFVTVTADYVPLPPALSDAPAIETSPGAR